jgi:uncharacterized membrane protein YgcG
MIRPPRKWTLLATAAIVLWAAASVGVAQDAGAWSGTVASVSGDDVALVGVPAHFRMAGSVTEVASGRSIAPQSLAPGTSVTLRVAEQEADGRFRADRVLVETKSPLTVSGAVGRVADDRRHVEVHGVEIEIDDHTGFSGRDGAGNVRSAADLRSGATVTATLAPTALGTLLATGIRAAATAVEPGEDQELKGIVTAITSTAWTVDTQVFLVSDDTVFRGSPALGDRVEVKFHVDAAGAFVAERIARDDDAPGIEVEFLGIVEAIGSASWTISGQVVNIDASTAIVGGPVVGSTVEVHARRVEAGLLATRIELEDRDGEPGDDHGNDGGNHEGGDDHGGDGNNSGSGNSGSNSGSGSGTSNTGGGHHGHGNDTGNDN